MAGYLGNFGRSVLEGLSFNNADEIEAAIRAAAQGDLNRYRQLKAQVEQARVQWGAQNPKAELAAQGLGMLAPALVPGGQGGALGAVGRAGRFAAEPVTALAKRFAPNVEAAAARWMPRAMPIADEMLTGALQSIGSADTLRDAPRQVAQDLPLNFGMSYGLRRATDAAGNALAVRRARRKAR